MNSPRMASLQRNDSAISRRDVICIVTTALNEFFAGQWVAPASQPSQGIEHCIGCHGPGTPTKKPRRWNQQGHMECLMCHDEHTA